MDWNMNNFNNSGGFTQKEMYQLWKQRDPRQKMKTWVKNFAKDTRERKQEEMEWYQKMHAEEFAFRFGGSGSSPSFDAIG